MKKIYSLMIAAIFAMVSSFTAMAEDVTFTLNIDNPDAVLVESNNQEITLVAGDNVFTVAEYTEFMVRAVPPYSMTVTAENGEVQTLYDNTWYFSPSSYSHSLYNIRTINLDESRTASCTVNVDCAEMVNAVLTGTYTTVVFQDGENTLKFDPQVETMLTLSSVDYMVPLYQVTVDGVNVAREYSAFYVPLTDGCVVDITAKIPEREVTLTFDYSANEDGYGAIESAQINYVNVENFDGLTLKAMAGSTITLTSNADYKITSVTINGNEAPWTGGYPYNFVIMDDTEIAVNAAPLGAINATVLVDDPDNFYLYRGYEYNNDVIELQAGSNSIELVDGNSLVSWKAANGCMITTVMLNNEILSEYTTSVILNDGDVLEFITSKIVMDKKFVFWIDDRTAADTYFSLTGSDRTSVDVTTGYNIVEYYSAMVPFYLSWYSEKELVNKVYVNGEYLAPLYEGSNSYELNINDDSVVKLFLATEPEECNVKVNLNDDPDVTVSYDIVTEMSEFPAEINVFKGTLFTITPADGEKVTVQANGIEVAQNSDDIYEIEIADTSTEITIAKTSALKSVINDAESSDIFNLMGVKVGGVADFNRLPAGIYIINGKKVIK